jgi:ABC-type multidrug transport system fused ATPase/permease subunit
MTAPAYRSTLATYLSPLKGRVTLLAVALLGSVGFQLVVPLVLRQFIDSALTGAVVSGLLAAGVIYLVAAVVNQVLSAAATYLGADIGWAATNRLREDLLGHVLSLDMGFHTETTPGEMIERIDGDVTAVSDFVSRFIVRLLGSGFLLIGVLAVVWVVDRRLGLGVSLYVAVVMAILLGMRNLAVRAAEEERETSARLYGFIEERLAGVEDIRANGAGAFTMGRFVPVMRDYYTRTTAAWRLRTIFWVVANTIFWAGDAVALTLGVWLSVRASITVGTAYLVLQYVQLVRRPIEQVAQQMQELQKAAGGIIRIDRLRGVKSRLDETGSKKLPTGALSIDFDQVEFGYEERGVLHDVSFHLGAGRTLGLLGRTGGGKTTIIRLIGRLYDPGRGTVSLGGVDLVGVDPRALRRAVGLVTQDVQLFRASVRDNLTFFDQTMTDEEIMAMLDRAGLGDWIRQIGLDTRLGSAGSGLSAGESQLLAFARVFLQDPGVVLLDEPSSRLDAATETLLTASMERLFAGRTVVIVAHRLETVQRADEIMVVGEGRILEHAPREDLAADEASAYSLLLAAGGVSDLLGPALPLMPS